MGVGAIGAVALAGFLGGAVGVSNAGGSDGTAAAAAAAELQELQEQLTQERAQSAKAHEQATAELKALRRQMQELRSAQPKQQVAELEAQIASENEAHAAALAYAAAASAALQREVADAKRQLADMTFGVKTQQGLAAKAAAARDDALAEVARLSSLLAAAEMERQHYTDAAAARDAELTRVKKLLAAAEKERQHERDTAATAKNEALAEVARLKSLLDQAKEVAGKGGSGAVVEALQHDLAEARQQVEALTQRNANLSSQLTVANELLARMQHVKEALQSIRRRGNTEALAVSAVTVSTGDS